MSALATDQQTLAATRSDSAPLRIALLGYRSNPFSGGQGVYLHYLSSALSQLGHHVDVISGEPYPDLASGPNLIKLPGLNLFEKPSYVRALRGKHFRSATDLFEWGSMVTGGFPEPYTFGRRVVKYLSTHRDKYDVIHDNQSLASGLLKVPKLGLPLVTTIHHPITMDRDIALAHEPSLSNRLLIRRWHYFLRMQTRVAQKLPRIATVSENSKKDIASAFSIEPEKIDVVYNGIDTNTFKPIPDIAREPFTLITTASADQPLKGTQHLMPALAELVDRFPNIRLIMIGKPKAGGKTEKLIERHNLSARLELVHGIPTHEIVRLYARSSVAIVPSEYEGFGLPAGEAMACGVPVVSTDGGALPEVVGDAGVVVPAKDPKAIADAVAALLNNDERRLGLGEAGRARIEQQFSWRQTAEQMTAIYERSRQ